MIVRVASVIALAMVMVLVQSGQYAYAHVLESDGSVGAILHIDPGDDPIAGEKSGFYFDFKDKTDRFRVQDCDCRLVIERAGKVIHDEPFSEPNGGDFVFPARDVYRVKAVGQPKVAGTFDAFDMGYDIRVERGADSLDGQANVGDAQSSAKPLLMIVAASIVLFALLLAIRYKLGNKVK